MAIDTQRYAENEAWLLFQLNEEPVRTQSDGDLNIFCLMDLATGLIVGTEFLSARSEEPTALEFTGLFGSAKSKAGELPKYLFLDADRNLGQVAKAATSIGVKVMAESASDLEPITQEAREGFAAHFMQG